MMCPQTWCPSAVYWENNARHNASCGLVGQEVILIKLWLKTVFSGIHDFLSSCKATIFVAKAMSTGGNYVNSSVVKYRLLGKAFHVLQLNTLLFSSKSGCHASYLNWQPGPVIQRMDKFIHRISLSGVKDGYPLDSYSMDKKLPQKAWIARHITIQWITYCPGSFQGDNPGIAWSFCLHRLVTRQHGRKCCPFHSKVHQKTKLYTCQV